MEISYVKLPGMIIALVIALLLGAETVHAHPIDSSFFDFEQTASGTVLTVAMQPPEAFEAVRRAGDEAWDKNLERFRERGEMLAAFVGSRVQLSRGGQACAWDPAIGPVASSSFEALAEGITVAAPVVCPVAQGHFTLTTDLFIDRFPGQQNLVRIAQDGDLRELFSLTSSTRSAAIDVDALSASHGAGSSNAASSSAKPASNVTALLMTLGLVVLFGLTQIRHVRFGRGSTKD